jgi:hypothetical protein
VSRKPTKGKESIALELFDRIEEYADELQEEADDKEPRRVQKLGSGRLPAGSVEAWVGTVTLP